jgi:hypothetical protein
VAKTVEGQGSTGVSIERRRFLRRAATVAWATPTIMTLAASVASAQTPVCSGPCNTRDDCPTGCNCSGNPKTCRAGS